MRRSPHGSWTTNARRASASTSQAERSQNSPSRRGEGLEGHLPGGELAHRGRQDALVEGRKGAGAPPPGGPLEGGGGGGGRRAGAGAGAGAAGARPGPPAPGLRGPGPPPPGRGRGRSGPDAGPDDQQQQQAARAAPPATIQRRRAGSSQASRSRSSQGPPGGGQGGRAGRGGIGGQPGRHLVMARGEQERDGGAGGVASSLASCLRQAQVDLRYQPRGQGHGYQP